MISPLNIENLDEAGSIYLVIHRSKSQAKDNESNIIGKPIEKTSHFCVAVDITGSSTTQEFIATHYDLYVKSPTDYTTYIDPCLKRHAWEYYHLVRKIGQIPLNDITRFHTPDGFGIDLHGRLIQGVYYPLLNANNGRHWSSILNCQTMTRSCIQFFGYEFPHDIQLTTDVVPTMFDPYLNGSLIIDQPSEKSEDKLSC